MKKMLSLALAAALSLSLFTGCASNNGNAGNNDSSNR